jgi:hypothetical protein
MSDEIIKHLGIPKEDLKWYHFASCKNMPLNWFFDDYENDSGTAKQVDEICLGCPVAKICLSEALEKKEKFGVWGGIYLSYGKANKQLNKHKSAETWKALKKIHGKSVV